ncbi:MAG: hypothetical protein M3T96_06405, partial [Acidobacteriota bacterium]|nr:hypothetical protein [Acidobacteriota bacterium]
MDYIAENLLTILILLPAFGALSVLGHQLFWKGEDNLKWITLLWTLLNFVVSLVLIFGKGAVSANGFFFEKNIS